MDWQKLRALSPPGPTFPRALWEKQPKDVSSNAWIDGVRGLAALIVTLDHLFWHVIGPLFQGYKSFPADQHSSILQLPGLSIIFGARAMVPLFFVISGYCITLSSIRARDPPSLLTTLSASVFRRALRLFLPVAFIALLSQLLYALGGYDAWPDHFDAASLPPAGSLSPLAHAAYLAAYAGSLFDQALAGPAARCTGFGAADCPVGLNGQLWTIPLELRGSFVVYLCCLGLARTRCTPRRCVLAGLVGVMMWRAAWEGATFVAGLLVAELATDVKGSDDEVDLLLFSPDATEPAAWLAPPRSYGQTVRDAVRGAVRGGRQWRNAGAAALALGGVWLLCFPNDPDMLGGYGPCYDFVFRHLSPGRWFVGEGAARAEFCWRAVGGVAFVAALAGSGRVSAALRRPFVSAAAQYFGRISFMLYLVHLMVIQCLLFRLYNPLVSVLGEERSGLAGSIARVVLLPPMFWISEVLVEVLDKRSVSLAKRLSKAWSVDEL